VGLTIVDARSVVNVLAGGTDLNAALNSGGFERISGGMASGTTRNFVAADSAVARMANAVTL